jgi:hypothetical protein
MWRRSLESNNETVAELCFMLNEEDPGENAAPQKNMIATLNHLGYVQLKSETVFQPQSIRH